MLSGSPEGTPAGFFDVDGTLCSTNVIQAYLDFRIRGSSALRRWAWLAFYVPKLPYYAFLDAWSRGRFLRTFYRSYVGVHLSDLERWAAGAAEHYWKPRLFSQALQRVQHHRAQGHRIVIISGGIEPVVQPLADILEADALIAAQPEVKDGRLTGRLIEGSLSGQRKAHATHQVSATLGIDLERSFAYADSYSDRKALESVGHPEAVNPDRQLRRLARRMGWPIHTWRHR